jgi:hypothetical protein
VRRGALTFNINGRRIPMTSSNKPQEPRSDSGAAFPTEAKLAVGVIALGVVVLILKTFGLF